MIIIKRFIENFKASKNDMYASPFKRLGGFIIDLAIITVLFNATVKVIDFFGFDSQFSKEKIVVVNEGTDDEAVSVEQEFNVKTFNTLYFIRLFISSMYFVLFLSSKKQATIGNMVFNTMVVSTKRPRITPIVAFLRFVGLLLNNTIFGLGYLTYFFTKDRSFLQDILSESNVINLKK